MQAIAKKSHILGAAHIAVFSTVFAASLLFLLTFPYLNVPYDNPHALSIIFTLIVAIFMLPTSVLLWHLRTQLPPNMQAAAQLGLLVAAALCLAEVGAYLWFLQKSTGQPFIFLLSFISETMRNLLYC